MNTIHSTFNRVNTSYTVIGNTRVQEMDNSSISAVVLGRGGRLYRKNLYAELQKLGIKEIISMEIGSKSHFDLEKEALENELLRFLILKDRVSTGEMINIGVSEATGKLILVIWDDMIISSKTISYRVFESISASENICTVPLFKGPSGEIIPSLMTPLYNRGLLNVFPVVDSKKLNSLYPHMYVGIYNREKFIQSGGYDIDIKNSYWQKLDFGLRVNMWGEEIYAHNSFTITIADNGMDIDDITPDVYYRLYCLKNLSVIIKKDMGYLPLRRFFSYFEKSGSSLGEAFKTFMSVRKWVYINRFRFKYSAPILTGRWDN